MRRIAPSLEGLNERDFDPSRTSAVCFTYARCAEAESAGQTIPDGPYRAVTLMTAGAFVTMVFVRSGDVTNGTSFSALDRAYRFPPLPGGEHQQGGFHRVKWCR